MKNAVLFRTAFHYSTNEWNNQDKNWLIFGKELYCKNNVRECKNRSKIVLISVFGILISICICRNPCIVYLCCYLMFRNFCMTIFRSRFFDGFYVFRLMLHSVPNIFNHVI